MAVPHFSVGIVGRSLGRSAVLSAAYRHCAKMDYEREARTVDYTRKQGLLHEEFSIPSDAPEWLRQMISDRSISGAVEAFWNKVELFERRSDAQLAKDMTIALPRELTAQQNIALVRDFVQQHVTARGMVADWVFHDPPGNPHVHLMTTLRPVTEAGFGPKKIARIGPDSALLRNHAGKILYELWAGSASDFDALREGWFACQNRHLALAGLDLHVDGCSFKAQGIDLQPTVHLGVETKAISRKQGVADRAVTPGRLALQEECRADNSSRICRRPEIVLDLITREKSVFDDRDVARVLTRHVDDANLFRELMARILQSPQALRLDRERLDLATGVRTPAKYTTRAMLRLEAGMIHQAIWLSQRPSHGVRDTVLQAVLSRHRHLSLEQQTAIAHIAGTGRIAAVIGRAGAGKTVMMKAAREAWETAGYRVVGGALAGKAAEGLEQEAGIASRTLSSWDLRWSQGRDRPDDRTIFVLDEAGMVASRQMAVFVDAVTRTGAKLVLIGDPEQLQPIEAGAAFRAIADRIGYAELETIYRQREEWMREASLHLARGHVGKAISAYRANGRVSGSQDKKQAISNLIADWSREHDPAKTCLILAHLRRDVRLLNELAREKLIERGIISGGFSFKTADGSRSFATGDQIVFLRNEASLGVKNGMLAKVVQAQAGRLVAELGSGDHRRHVTIEQRFYNNLDHGYATTIHKSQGATVDRVKVLASLSLDRHLTYVAMTRHREDLGLYFGKRSFARAGSLEQILSRRNAKETTLDYAGGSFYRQALRFAEARGLHLVNVARTLLRDRLRWTVRQRPELTELGKRLSAAGARLGLRRSQWPSLNQSASKRAEPMVSGMTITMKPIEQAVEERLSADRVLQRQWEDVSARFRLVYARPDAAFRAVDVDAMLKDRATAAATIVRLANGAASFGMLKGQTGPFAARNDRQDREASLANIPALARSLERFVQLRADAGQRYEVEERHARRRALIEIPALSANAKLALERLRDALDRHDLPGRLELALSDTMVRAELLGFARAVSARFGEGCFLPDAARHARGPVFEAITSGMSPGQKNEIRSAWEGMRVAQQLAQHLNSTMRPHEAERLGQTKSSRLSLK